MLTTIKYLGNKIKEKAEAIFIKSKLHMEQVKENLQGQEGISTIEIILVLVVLIALIIIFRDQLLSLINSIFGRITSDSASI